MLHVEPIWWWNSQQGVGLKMHVMHITEEDTKAWRWRELPEVTTWGCLRTVPSTPTQSLRTHLGRCPLFLFALLTVYSLFKIEWKHFFWEDLTQRPFVVPSRWLNSRPSRLVPHLNEAFPSLSDYPHLTMISKQKEHGSRIQEKGAGILAAQGRRWCGIAHRALS